MRYLVTGGGGFLGQNLVRRLLDREDEVVVLGRSRYPLLDDWNVPCVQGDVRETLGLVMAEWLWETFPRDKEGQLSKRLNALVTGAVCADVARELGVRDHLKLGKQARDDGAADSDNVLGDVMEALIGALYREGGLDAARPFIRRAWNQRVHAGAKAPQHPKSALQEWAAAAGRRMPTYAITDRSGPHHAPRFTVTVSIGPDEASASGTNKQEAETAAAKALLAKLDK